MGDGTDRVMTPTEVAVMVALDDPAGAIQYTYEHPTTGADVIAKLIQLATPDNLQRGWYLDFAETLTRARAEGMALLRRRR